jgi:hypothetical protein
VRIALTAVAALLVAIALAFMRPAGEPGVLMRDFSAYYAAGATWLAHGDPYSATTLSAAEQRTPGANANRLELLPFVGLPASILAWGALARLDYASALRAWAGILGASILLLLAASIALAGRRAPPLRIIASIAFAFCFVPLTSDLVLGQAALPAYAAMLVGVYLVSRVTFGGAVAFCVASLQPNVALPAAVVLRSLRGIVAVAVAAVACYAAGAVVAGSGWIAPYAHMLMRHATAERFSAIQITPAAIAYGFGAPKDVALIAGAAIGVLTLAYAIGGIVTTRDVPSQVAVACCAVPFVAGFVHEHDLIVTYFPILFCMRLTPPRYRPMVIFAAILVAVNWLDFAQQPQAVWQDVVLAAAAIVALVALGTEAHERELPGASNAFAAFATLGIAGLVALGAWIGVHYPLPIWPNDMTPFAPQTGADAATIWYEEQLHTGLLTPHIASAVLRSFSLLGCFVLLFASIKCRRS